MYILSSRVAWWRKRAKGVQTFLKKYKKQKKKLGTIERGYGPKNVVLSLMELYCKGGFRAESSPRIFFQQN